MIRTLSGTVQTIFLEGLVVDVHGVGYEVWMPPRQLSHFSVGESVLVHIYTHVKEDAIELYGFASVEDRQLFVLLIGVSGVGPKTALGVLNDGYQAGVEAIRQSNVAFFQSIPRLGKKTAQKIILELQSKVGGEGGIAFELQSPVVQDVQEALESMGYTLTDIQPLLHQIEAGWTAEQALKWSLQQLKR